jgi:glycosyltransferase involved in cell wall biosynthesis
VLRARDFLRDQIIIGTPRPRDPLVSVVLPTYRRREGGFLARAIESVLGQTLDDLELLIIDDGSTDGSHDLIETFRARDDRVRHVRHDLNSGLPALRVNEGIGLSRGRYLAFQFDDDVWRPDALASLRAEAERHAEPVVVVGGSRCTGAAERILPDVELNLVNLYDQNRLANNSVLLPRMVVQMLGMYDCHIGMRRLCDWDLWLRYMKHVPFVTIPDVVAEAYENLPGSIGKITPWDLSLFRQFHDIPRGDLLTPERWLDYPVDSLEVAGVRFERDVRRRLYEQHVVPLYLRVRHHFPELEGFPSTMPPKPKNVLYTKSSYDVSNDVTLNHYDAPSYRRGSYKACFQPLDQVSDGWTRDADALLLVRTLADRARLLLYQGLSTEVPVGVYLDDDLLSFHEYGPEFSYLAPGTPGHENLKECIRQADAVWVTNAFLAGAVSDLSPRCLPHNNAVPLSSLPDGIRTRSRGRPFRIGYVGSGYRIEEFSRLWEGLRRLARQRRGEVEFEFWGLDVSSLPRLEAPVRQRPFTFSYARYLEQLRGAEFDVLLAPLLDSPRPRLGKSLIKYYECAVAGALGIFSRVPPYAALPEGFTCLKADNTVEDWFAALETAVTMPDEERQALQWRALQHVREDFTAEAQIHRHEAAWRATEFHSRTRLRRRADGRPRVAYFLHSAFLGGGEMQLWRRLTLAREYGIEPIVVLPRIVRETDQARHVEEDAAGKGMRVEFADYRCFTEPLEPAQFNDPAELQDIDDLLERCAPALVHSVTFIPSLGQVCARRGIPHVASLYAVDDAFAWPRGRPGFFHADVVQSDSLRYAERWSGLLEAEKLCAREVAPAESFAIGQRRYLASGGRPAPRPNPARLVVAGTLQPRKRQLETIEAVGRLCCEGWDCRLELHGYTHFYPDYVDECESIARAYGIEDRVTLAGFGAMPEILRSADVILSLSTVESFPSTIKEAMAAGVLVVATPVGGIPELILDGVSGILCPDVSVEGLEDGIRRALALPDEERWRIVQQARRVARSEFHSQRAASDLLLAYTRALDLGTERRRQLFLWASFPPIATPARVETPAPEASPEPHVDEPIGVPTGHLPVAGALSYRLVPTRPEWTGVTVVVGTHGRALAGELSLRILSDSGRPLREATASLSGQRDADWLTLRFPAIRNAVGKPFRLEFVARISPEGRVSLFESSPPEARLKRTLRRAGLPLSGNTLYCRLWYGS